MVAGERLAEVLLPSPADRGDELRIALGITVVRVAQSGVAECGVDNGLVGGEIGIADTQIDDILVFGKSLGVEG